MSVQEHTDNGLYYRSWIPEQTAKAAVMLVHGLGEHCQRYDPLAEYVNERGIAVHAMDLPCHGRSEGIRGHVDSFKVFQDAATSLYERCQQAHPNTPIFLLGHSMGGLIAARFLIDNQDKFKGALLSGAAIQSPQEPPAWQVAVIRLLSRLVPKLPILALDASGISRVPTVVERYMADPLVSKDKLSARFLVELTDTMQDTKAGASKISLPILIMHGSADVMTAPEGSRELHDSVASTDKQLKIYGGLFHEIFNEPEAESIYAELVAWIEDRI